MGAPRSCLQPPKAASKGAGGANVAPPPLDAAPAFFQVCSNPGEKKGRPFRSYKKGSILPFSALGSLMVSIREVFPTFFLSFGGRVEEMTF